MAMADLLTVGKSGVRANQRLLTTSSNNIANVNTPGYSLQRTFYDSDQRGGVGQGQTQRIMNNFAQAQMYRDHSGFTNREAYLQEVSNLDALLSDETISLSSKIDDMFTQLHSMTDNPTALSTRELTLSQFDALEHRYSVLSEQYTIQQDAMNEDLEGKASEANELIGNIYQMNREIMALNGHNHRDAEQATLMDKRDAAIKDLSGLMKINTVDQMNGSRLVFLSSGQALVMEDDKVNIGMREGDPDITQREMILSFESTTRPLSHGDIGGEIGGMIEYRQTVLDVSRNQLGQLAVAMADGLNAQNRKGMDLNGNLGQDIFEIPNFAGMAYASNIGTGSIEGSFIRDQGSEVTPFDYKVTFSSPTEFEIQRFRGDEPVDSPIAGDLSVDDKPLIDGLQLDMSSGNFQAADRFLIQPTRDAAVAINLVMKQPERLALAAPISVEGNLNNRGRASIALESVYNTDPASSHFTQPGGYSLDGPAEVRINAAGGYEVFDGNGVLMGTAAASSGGQNVFEAAGLGKTVGFDINIDGEVAQGDSFTMGFNVNGFNDNYNALRFTDLQQRDLVRTGTALGGDNKMTFNEGYASVVSFVGGRTSEARIAESAAKSLFEQSEERHLSISGVNLDEEAANLVKFQQSYAASAQVISAARDVFDTILNATR